MLRWLPFAWVACATPPVVVGDGSSSDRPIAGVAIDAATVPVVAPRPPSPPKPGVPSGFLSVVTGPEDASFVVTSDSGGGLRLWPTLDGSREPLIIPTLHPVGGVDAIRDGDDVAVAALDQLGQLELLRVRRDGEVLSDLEVALERPVIALAATAHGFIALRDDQRIVAFDSHGVARGEVDPDPGVRVHQLLERAGHVLAIFDGTAKRRRGRMLELDERGLAWGARTGPLALGPDQLALSPNGKQLVGIRDHVPVVLELATGHEVGTPVLAPLQDDVDAFALAFVDDRTVWFSRDGITYEWPVAGVPTALLTEVTTAIHVTAHAVITAKSQALQIMTSHKTRYLGYRSPMISDLVAARDGWVALDGRRAVHFDPQFVLDREYAEPGPDNASRQLALIDAHHVVKFGYDNNPLLYTLGSTKEPTLLPATGYQFTFERSTGIAEVDATSDLQFVRWDPAHGEFDHSIAHWDRSKTGLEQVRLYNPATSDGVVAAVITLSDDYQRVELTSVRAIAPFRTSVRTFPTPKVGDGEFIHAVTSFMPSRPSATASADQTLIVEIADGRMALHDRDGNERWARTVRGAVGVAWSANDELIAYGDGEAKVDLETGDFVDARCGWQFGLWETPNDEAFGAARMCVEP